MSQDWAQPGQGRNALYRATTTLSDSRGVPVIGAYPLRRPDGQWAILLINRGSGAVDAQPVRVLHVKGPKDVGVLQVEPGQFGRQHQRGGESREDQGRQGQQQGGHLRRAAGAPARRIMEDVTGRWRGRSRCHSVSRQTARASRATIGAGHVRRRFWRRVKSKASGAQCESVRGFTPKTRSEQDGGHPSSRC